MDHHNWVNEWVGKFKPAPHIFGNLLEQVPADSFVETDSFCKRALDVEKAGLSTHQFCHVHGGLCQLMKPVDFDMSGLPCEDNSTANVKRRYLDGRFGSCYLIWAKKHRSQRTPLLVLENTPELWKNTI